MKRLSILVFLVFVLCSQVAFAASWYYIGPDLNGDQIYIDNESVQKNNNYAIVWVKTIKPDNTVWQMQQKVDHIYKTITLMYVIVYDANGNVTNSGADTDSIPIIPGSVGDMIYHAIWSN